MRNPGWTKLPVSYQMSCIVARSGYLLAIRHGACGCGPGSYLRVFALAPVRAGQEGVS